MPASFTTSFAKKARTLSCASALVCCVLIGAQASASEADIAALDRRVLSVSADLLVGNSARCDRHMPYVGLAFHSADQYPSGARDFVEQAFHADHRLAILTTDPAGAAAQAGLRPGMLVAAIGDWKPDETILGEGEQLRLRAFEQLAMLGPGEPVLFNIGQASGERTVTLQPVKACRQLVEMVPSNKKFARSNGEIVQVSSKLAIDLSDDQLAVVLAHELAHSILKHRAMLEAENVKKGLLGEFGKSARLGREAEIEADLLSVHLLRDAGYDPHIAPAFWRSKAGKSISGGLFRSRIYPSSKTRAVQMEEEISKMPPSARGSAD